MKSLLIMLPIIFCLLMSNIANAECAWVLWMKNYYFFSADSEHPNARESTYWEIILAVPTFEQCGKSADAFFINRKNFYTKEKHPGNKKMETGSLFIHESFPNGFYIESYVCLPDTIDPRK